MLILYQTVSVAFLQREEEIRLNVCAFINTFLFLHILPRLSLSPVLSFTLFSSQATGYYMTLSLQNESRVVFLKNSDALFWKMINSIKLGQKRTGNKLPLSITSWILNIGEVLSNELQLIILLHSKWIYNILEREVLPFICILGL